MPQPDPTPLPERRPRPDWPRWLALAWALCFGLLYARMVVDQRGGKLHDMLVPSVLRAGLATEDREPGAENRETRSRSREPGWCPF